MMNKKMHLAQGRFIVIEGIDGSGKSTQSRKIAQRLESQGYDIYHTFEPTNGPIGTLIRKMLEGKLDTDQRTLEYLFAADRTDHIVNKRYGMRQKIDQGKIVLCDRYYFSSYAYHAQYIDMEWVIHANTLNAQILRPDATLFIDVDPEICFDRIIQNRNRLDMYEKMDDLKAVRVNYFKAFERLKAEETIILINGNGSIEEVEERILKEVKNVLEQH